MEVGKLVGMNVRRIRSDKGLTQEELAELSGLSQQYISSLETGARNPTVETLVTLAHAMRVTHVDLVVIPDGVKIRVPKRKAI
jgi:transcriptional regulator with XRE-family HTH domain